VQRKGEDEHTEQGEGEMRNYKGNGRKTPVRDRRNTLRCPDIPLFTERARPLNEAGERSPRVFLRPGLVRRNCSLARIVS